MLFTKQIVLTCAGAGLLASGVQAATFTQVNAPWGTEKSHAELFSQFYGGEFVQNGNDFSNGVVKANRVDDDKDQSYDLNGWTAEALATWAGASQSFGTADEGILFDVQGKNGQQISGGGSDAVGGSDIHFARFGNERATFDVSTDADSNRLGRDHVVTYTISVDDVPQENLYYLFFEDANDWDYNDMVVRITSGEDASLIIPEPSSLALLGLGGLAMFRRRRLTAKR